MLMAYGFVARVFEVFDRHRTPVDLIATSEVSVSLTVDDPDQLVAVERDLAGLGEVKVLRGMAIVSVVGRGFVSHPGLAGRIFQTLRDDQRGHDLVRRLGRERVVRGGRRRRGARGAHAAPGVLRDGRRRMRVAVVGYGKMGHEVEAVLRERRHEPVCVDLGEPFPTGCVVGIDFTEPSAVIGNVQAALAAGARYVVGTTGWLDRLPEVSAHGRQGRRAGSSTPPTSRWA